MTDSYRIDWKRMDINLEGRGTPIGTGTALLVAPVLGLAFIVFLPMAGFYLSVQACIAFLTKRRAQRLAKEVQAPGR